MSSMEEDILFPEKTECHITAENVTLTMLINDEHTPRIQSNTPVSLHTHAGSELFACQRGAIQLQMQHGIVTLHAGEIGIIPPGLLHCMFSSTADAVWLAFDFFCTANRKAGRTDLMRELSPLLTPDCLTIVRGAQAEIHEMAAITNANGNAGYLSALRFLCALCSLSHHPLQQIEDGTNGHASLPHSFFEKRKDLDRLSRLDHLVNAYYTSELSVARAAELLFISERQLQRITQKEYGVSFAQLLCRTRLTAARALLSDNALTIEQIATATGFASRAALTRAMLRECGITPAEYRQKLTPSAD